MTRCTMLLLIGASSVYVAALGGCGDDGEQGGRASPASASVTWPASTASRTGLGVTEWSLAPAADGTRVRFTGAAGSRTLVAATLMRTTATNGTHELSLAVEVPTASTTTLRANGELVGAAADPLANEALAASARDLRLQGAREMGWLPSEGGGGVAPQTVRTTQLVTSDGGITLVPEAGVVLTEAGVPLVGGAVSSCSALSVFWQSVVEAVVCHLGDSTDCRASQTEAITRGVDWAAGSGNACDGNTSPPAPEPAPSTNPRCTLADWESDGRCAAWLAVWHAKSGTFACEGAFEGVVDENFGLTATLTRGTDSDLVSHVVRGKQDCQFKFNIDETYRLAKSTAGASCAWVDGTSSLTMNDVLETLKLQDGGIRSTMAYSKLRIRDSSKREDSQCVYTQDVVTAK